MKVDLIQKFKELMQQAKKEGITLNKTGGDPLVFEEGVAKTPVQKKVLMDFEEIVSTHSKKAGMTRREFLATPLSVTAAAMAISTGLGFSFMPSTAQASVPPNDTPFSFMSFGYPIVPNLAIGTEFYDDGDNVRSDAFINPHGKIALVIGGSKGIGRNTAEKLHRAGFTVIATSRHPWTYAPPPFPLWELDLSISSSIKKFVKRVKKELGRVDLLICNAGRFYLGRPLQSSRDQERFLMESNVDGHISLMKEIIPIMPTEGYARLLITSSISNHVYATFRFPFPDFESQELINLGCLFGAYNESKARLTRFGTALKMEQENSGNPNFAVAPFNYPQTPTNLSVSIIHPIGVNSRPTENGNDFIQEAIKGENAPYLDFLLAYFYNGFSLTGISVEVAGNAFLQMAMVKDEPDAQYPDLMRPYLHTILSDVTLNPEDPEQQFIFFGQLSAMVAMAEQQEITVRSFVTPNIRG